MADAYETMELMRRKRQNFGSTADNIIVTPKWTNALQEEKTNYHVATARGSSGFLQKRNDDNGAEMYVNPSQDSSFKQIVAPNQLCSGNDITILRREYGTAFSQLAKPRVRYDVEVFTRIIIYSGVSL